MSFSFSQGYALDVLQRGSGKLRYYHRDDMDCQSGECRSGWYACDVPHPQFGLMNWFIHPNTLRWLHRVGFVDSEGLTELGRAARI